MRATDADKLNRSWEIYVSTTVKAPQKLVQYSYLITVTGSRIRRTEYVYRTHQNSISPRIHVRTNLVLTGEL
jgi:hypothetical protein